MEKKKSKNPVVIDTSMVVSVVELGFRIKGIDMKKINRRGFLKKFGQAVAVGGGAVIAAGARGKDATDILKVAEADKPLDKLDKSIAEYNCIAEHNKAIDSCSSVICRSDQFYRSDFIGTYCNYTTQPK